MRPRRSTSTALAGALTLGLAALAVPSGASAGPFEIAYDFSSTAYGNAGWVYDDDGDAGGWYTAGFTPGTGLRIAPQPSNTDVYLNGHRGVWGFGAPGTSTITSAKVDSISGTSGSGQIARIYLYTPVSGLSYPPSSARELLSGATWSNSSFTLTPVPGRTSQLLAMWLYTGPCNEPGDPPDPRYTDCRPTHVDTNAQFVQLRKVSIRLDDPTPPTVELGGLADGQQLDNANRRQTITIPTVDADSGISKVQLRISGPGGRRTQTLGSWKPDRFNTTPRPDATPPLATAQAPARTITLPRRGGRFTITALATNGATMTATRSIAVTVAGPVKRKPKRPRRPARRRGTQDRTAPTITLPPKPQAGSTVRIRDRQSGIARVTVHLDGTRVGSGSGCTGGAKRCTAIVPRDALPGQRLTVGAEDRADNRRSTSKRLRKRTPRTWKYQAICGPRDQYSAVLRVRPGITGPNPASQVLIGSAKSDILNAGDGNDCLIGGAGGDTLEGSDGDDRISGGPGIDVISASTGDDVVFSADASQDHVRCGDGYDTVYADARDLVDADCERVIRR